MSSRILESNISVASLCCAGNGATPSAAPDHGEEGKEAQGTRITAPLAGLRSSHAPAKIGRPRGGCPRGPLSILLEAAKGQGIRLCLSLVFGCIEAYFRNERLFFSQILKDHVYIIPECC